MSVHSIILILINLFYFGSQAQASTVPVKNITTANSCRDTSKVKAYCTNQKDSLIKGNEIIKLEMPAQDKGWADKWLPILSLLPAIIVAIVAYMGVIKQSRAQTVSNFRVKWIDELRTSYSEFQVTIRNFGAKVRDHKLSLDSYNKDEDAEKLQFLQTKIKLLLNHDPRKQPRHVEFWGMLVRYIDYNHRYYKGKYIESERVRNFLDKKRLEIEDVLLEIIKNEWKKAKRF